MPRDGSGVLSAPAGTTATSGTTIESAKYNAFVNDWVTDGNTARPIVAGGTGATTAGAALTNLGGQPLDAGLTSIAGLTTAADRMIYTTASDTYAVATLTAAGRAILDDADAAAQLATLGAQAADATLTSLAGLSLVAGDILYATGADTLVRLPKGTAGQALVMNSGATAPEWVVAASAPLSRTVISGAPTAVDFTFNPTLYDEIIFVLGNVTPTTDGVSLQMLTSSNGGSSFDTGASDYRYQRIGIDGAVIAGSQQTAFTSLNISAFVTGNAASEEGVSGTVSVLLPSLAQRTRVHAAVSNVTTAGALTGTTFFGERQSSADVDAVRFFLSSGTFASGTITMYGMKAA